MILRDQYAPVMVSSNRKCIPILRIVSATFKELHDYFADMIKLKAGCNDNSGVNFTPSLVIASLLGQLVKLGVEGYIQDV